MKLQLRFDRPCFAYTQDILLQNYLLDVQNIGNAVDVPEDDSSLHFRGRTPVKMSLGSGGSRCTLLFASCHVQVGCRFCVGHSF